jgi:hypothetical protein
VIAVKSALSAPQQQHTKEIFQQSATTLMITVDAAGCFNMPHTHHSMTLHFALERT